MRGVGFATLIFGHVFEALGLRALMVFAHELHLT
jgi:hypothetical protein